MIEAEVVALDAPDVQRTGWGLPVARGIYYQSAGDKPRTAVIAVHYNLDFSQHYLAELLARRGYGFLGWNTRFCGQETSFLLDRALVDIGLGVSWLRQRGAETVVLLGNSGGGSLMAAYLAQSRHPVISPAHGRKLAQGVEQLPGGDLYVSVAAHPGRPEVLTNWLDPAVTDELDPIQSDPTLDMYNPDNGPPYGPDFVTRYREGQRARNQRITDWCKQELGRLERAGYSDRAFTVNRTWADLRFTDPDIDPSDRPTPACYRGDPTRANRGVDGIGNVSTLRSWLGMWSLEESQCSSVRYLGTIDVPSLVVQAKGDTGVFPGDARAVYDGLGSDDKDLVELPGDHYFRGPGEPREKLADLLATWVDARSGDRATA